MSDPATALGGVSFIGFATVHEIGPLGMISLRVKPGVTDLMVLPGQRQIVQAGDRSVGWMSPDEYLLILPYAEVAAEVRRLSGIAGHHLAVDVSDARAAFRIDGPAAGQVLQKLSPVDFDTLPAGELRRTRAAQVAVALWRDQTGFTLICFRSVARYVFDLLSHAATPGSELRNA